MNNPKTTLVGILFAIATYIVAIGGKLPSTRNEWAFSIASIALVVLGAVSKDYNVVGGTSQATNSEGDKLKPENK